MCKGNTRRTRERREEISKIKMTENFSKLISDNKPNPESRESIKQYNAKKTTVISSILETCKQEKIGVKYLKC